MPQSTITAAQPTRHIDALRPHPDNPRFEISEDDPGILDLAGSIIRKGVIEPLVINSANQIYAGHRRRVASRVAYKQTKDKKFLTVPVVINDSPPEDALEIMLAENKQRANLTPLEEARTLYALQQRKNLTVADLARAQDLPPKDVSQLLAILKLEAEVQALYHANELPLTVAPLLSRVMTRDKQISYAGLIARHQLGVTEFRKVVERDLAPPAPDPPPRAGEPPLAVQQPSLRARPRPHSGPVKKRAVPPPTSGVREHPTRAEAVAALARNLSGKVSLISVKSVLESVCCACGMAAQSEVCRSCPLPRLILGIVGRADLPASARSRASSREEEDES